MTARQLLHKKIQSSLHHTVYNIHSALLQILSQPKHTEALSSMKRFSSGCCVSPAKDKISAGPCEVLIMSLPAMTWQKRGSEPSAPSQLVARSSFGEGDSSIMLIKPCGSWNLCFRNRSIHSHQQQLGMILRASQVQFSLLCRLSNLVEKARLKKGIGWHKQASQV